MRVGFVITAFNKEEFRDLCLRVIYNYKRIRPEVVVCYNGDDHEFPCDIRMGNRGHQDGDCDLTLAGYDHLITNGHDRIIKIGLDTCLCDEFKLLELFHRMEHIGACYAGNRWGHQGEETFSTDIMLLDLRSGAPFSGPFYREGPAFEWWMFNQMRRRRLHALMIDERIPVHPGNRMECAKLKWTMHHQLENNVANLRNWGYGGLV